MATPTDSMTGVALPSLKSSQYPTAVQATSKTKKTTRLITESLEILKQYSRKRQKTFRGFRGSFIIAIKGVRALLFISAFFGIDHFEYVIMAFAMNDIL